MVIMARYRPWRRIAPSPATHAPAPPGTHRPVQANQVGAASLTDRWAAFATRAGIRHRMARLNRLGALPRKRTSAVRKAPPINTLHRRGETSRRLFAPLAQVETNQGILRHGVHPDAGASRRASMLWLNQRGVVGWECGALHAGDLREHGNAVVRRCEGAAKSRNDPQTPSAFFVMHADRHAGG